MFAKGNEIFTIDDDLEVKLVSNVADKIKYFVYFQILDTYFVNLATYSINRKLSLIGHNYCAVYDLSEITNYDPFWISPHTDGDFCIYAICPDVIIVIPINDRDSSPHVIKLVNPLNSEKITIECVTRLSSSLYITKLSDGTITKINMDDYSIKILNIDIERKIIQYNQLDEKLPNNTVKVLGTCYLTIDGVLMQGQKVILESIYNASIAHDHDPSCLIAITNDNKLLHIKIDKFVTITIILEDATDVKLEACSKYDFDLIPRNRIKSANSSI